MYTEIDKNKPIQISKAKKSISSYSKAVGNPRGEAELMTYFVEYGNRFTVDFGDIDETFYNALKLMYKGAINKVRTLQEECRSEFRSRLEDIMILSSDIG
jgi:hypothetical protein